MCNLLASFNLVENRRACHVNIASWSSVSRASVRDAIQVLCPRRTARGWEESGPGVRH